MKEKIEALINQNKARIETLNAYIEECKAQKNVLKAQTCELEK